MSATKRMADGHFQDARHRLQESRQVVAVQVVAGVDAEPAACAARAAAANAASEAACPGVFQACAYGSV
jgi:hypothetical protein